MRTTSSLSRPASPLTPFGLAQRSSGEFPGCILWAAGSTVEYNDHTDQSAGCNVGKNGGQCVCTRVSNGSEAPRREKNRESAFSVRNSLELA